MRAAYFKHAVEIMENQMDTSEVQELLEWNSCCKSGAREKRSKEFSRVNKGLTIEERLMKIAKASYMNMGKPELDEQGDLIVHAVAYTQEGKYACACPNVSKVKLEAPISKNYCFCCAGHFKYHYEIMLDVKLNTTEIVSSPLDSDGADPCVIRYEIVNI